VSESKNFPMNVLKSEYVPAHWANPLVVPLELIENWIVSSIEIQIS
jgi:hypothetical protein